MRWAIHNGQLVEAEKFALSALDRGFLLGDGLFETMRAYEGSVFRLSAHLRRLERSAAVFNLRAPWTSAELTEMITRLLSLNELSSARVRLTLSRGLHTGAMNLPATTSPTLVITADPIPDNLADRLSAGISLGPTSVRFSENNPIFCHKTLNRLPHLFARHEAEKAGADEALILDERGNVLCGSTGNLFACQYGQLFTPPLSAPLLPGITRAVVLELARGEGLAVREDFFSPLMLMGADEVFLSNSVQELVPVIRVGEHPVGSGRPGPVWRQLLERYRELTGSLIHT